MNIDRDAERLEYTETKLVDSYFRIGPLFEQTFPGSSITIPREGGYRPPLMQNEVHLSGASGYSGISSFSKHQAFPAEALDFIITEHGQMVGNGADPRYRWVGEEFEREGFRWGGRFKRPDWDHIEKIGIQPIREQVLAGYTEYERKEERKEDERETST